MDILFYLTGPLDVMLILHDTKTGRFHPAFNEEHPLAGSVEPVEKMTFARLKSKFHHTSGFETLNEAKEEIEKGQLYL